MRNRLTLPALGLLAISAAFNLGCPGTPRPSLRVRVLSASPTGEPVPLPEAALHLLDVDPIHYVMTGGGADAPRGAEVYGAHPRLRMLAGLMNARRLSAYSLGPDIFLLMDQSRPLWEPRVVGSAQTDEEGEATFGGLGPGYYWLVGYSRSSEREAFWSQRVAVEGIEN